jgi:hypothetical protein
VEPFPSLHSTIYEHLFEKRKYAENKRNSSYFSNTNTRPNDGGFAVNNRKISLVLAVIFSLNAFPASATDTDSEFVLKEDLRIGVEYGDEDFMFASISDVELDSQGNIYILDLKNFRIQVFDESGGIINSIILSKGQGPEEIGAYARMAVLPDGTIGLLDFYERKVLLLNKSGEFLRSFRLDMQPKDMVAAEGTLVVLGFDKNHILHEIDLEGRLLTSFGDPFAIPSNLSAYKDMIQIRLPMRIDRSASGEIFLLNPFAYEIIVFKDRIHTQTIKGANPVFKPLRIAKAGGNRISLIFPLAHVQITGGLLLSTIVETKGLYEMTGHMDIFRDGEFQETQSLRGLPLVVDSRGRLYVSEQEDIPQLVRYIITPSGSRP